MNFKDYAHYQKCENTYWDTWNIITQATNIHLVNQGLSDGEGQAPSYWRHILIQIQNGDCLMVFIQTYDADPQQRCCSQKKN